MAPPFDLLPQLLKGLGVTLEITALSAILAFLMAFLAGFARLSKWRIIRIVAGVYVEIFRGTSLLIQLFWLFYALPLIGIELPPMVAGVMAIGLNYAAYGSEVVRGSILAVPKGQLEAAVALNMTPGIQMRRVVLPQAFLMMLPAFGNLLIELLKGTALVSLITIPDLAFQGNMLNTTTMRTVEIYSWLLVIYFLIAWPITWAIRRLERKASAGRS